VNRSHLELPANQLAFMNKLKLLSRHAANEFNHLASGLLPWAAARPSLDFENFSKEGYFLSFEWEKTNFGPPRKIFEKSPSGPLLENIFPTPMPVATGAIPNFLCPENFVLKQKSCPSKNAFSPKPQTCGNRNRLQFFE